jgi:hypothetical protein
MGRNKVIMWALAVYFISKYIIEPSPLGAIIANFLSPIGAIVSNLFPVA